MIPESFLNREDQTIIIPAFEYLPKMHVSQREFATVMKKYMPNVPKNKSALATCMNLNSKDCSIFRDKAHLHVCFGPLPDSQDYLIQEWFSTPPSLLYSIPCLNGDRQEPSLLEMIVIPSYLLIKKTPTLPLYDERFVGYGWNKVQWIENLRMAGYNFYVFEHGFIIHCPHPMYLC